jgi:hypothetical protein
MIPDDSTVTLEQIGRRISLLGRYAFTANLWIPFRHVALFGRVNARPFM